MRTFVRWAPTFGLLLLSAWGFATDDGHQLYVDGLIGGLAIAGLVIGLVGVYERKRKLR